MSILNDPFRRLRALLALVGIHSIAVGIGLMAHPASVFEFMGYARCSEPFFPTQGGVFHIVMAVGYLMAAADPSGNRCLITFAVVVNTSRASRVRSSVATPALGTLSVHLDTIALVKV